MLGIRSFQAVSICLTVLLGVACAHESNEDSASTRGARTHIVPPGVRNTLIVLINFADLAASCTESQVRDAVFDADMSASAFYEFQSGGAVSFSGDVATVNVSANFFDSCDRYAWGALADAQLDAMSIDRSAYQHVIYEFPSSFDNTYCNSMGWWGYADGDNRRTFVRSCADSFLVAHELGHNLGMGHSMLADMSARDDSDIMSGHVYANLNSVHKVALGFVASSRITSVASRTTTHTITDLSLPAATTTQVVLVPAAGDQHIYLSYRRALPPYDDRLDAARFAGLNIHRDRRAGEEDDSFLLDVLQNGDTYTDSSSGITVDHVVIAGASPDTISFQVTATNLPVDAPDAGVVDAGSPIMDAGSDPHDAGATADASTFTDLGTPPRDASTLGGDAAATPAQTNPGLVGGCAVSRHSPSQGTFAMLVLIAVGVATWRRRGAIRTDRAHRSVSV